MCDLHDVTFGLHDRNRSIPFRNLIGSEVSMLMRLRRTRNGSVTPNLYRGPNLYRLRIQLSVARQRTTEYVKVVRCQTGFEKHSCSCSQRRNNIIQITLVFTLYLCCI